MTPGTLFPPQAGGRRISGLRASVGPRSSVTDAERQPLSSEIVHAAGGSGREDDQMGALETFDEDAEASACFYDRVGLREASRARAVVRSERSRASRVSGFI